MYNVILRADGTPCVSRRAAGLSAEDLRDFVGSRPRMFRAPLGPFPLVMVLRAPVLRLGGCPVNDAATALARRYGMIRAQESIRGDVLLAALQPGGGLRTLRQAELEHIGGEANVKNI